MSESSAEAVEAVAGAAASTAGSWRVAGVAGMAIGVVAAGAAAGVALERLTVGRGMRRKARLALDSAGPYGAVRGTPGKAYADDGTELYYEVDDVEPEGGSAPRRRRLFGRKDPAPVTVVFSHGYCLNQDSWHYQRRDLDPRLRRVFWDQRGHGRSGRGDLAHATIDQCGEDLLAVLRATAVGPVVLVGHSMGGMTI
ncbi:MAG: alpha/beta hydrolase, partial [Streptomyces sp.]|nr:alpha/beta hydrolase [Streptomyces sp.]